MQGRKRRKQKRIGVNNTSKGTYHLPPYVNMNPFHKLKNVDKEALDKSIHAYQQAELNWNEEQALDWIQLALNEKYPSDASMWQVLFDGVVLCKYVVLVLQTLRHCFVCIYNYQPQY